MRIDQDDPATYGAYAARQFLATAEAEPRFRDGMTKRPSASSIRITYTEADGTRREVGVREIFCKVEGDALVLTEFEDATGAKVKDLPLAVPRADEPEDDGDDEDRLHDLLLAELDGESSRPTVEVEPEPEPVRPVRERRMPTGPLRQVEEAAQAAAVTPKAPAAPEPAPRGPAAMPVAPKPVGAAPAPQAGPGVRALAAAEAASLRALIEAKAGQARWASGLLMQAAERHPSDRKLQNEHLANLLRFSIDPARPESRTQLAAALRGVLEEVLAYKAGVLDRDPLKAEKVSLQPYARAALAPTPIDDAHVKTVSGTAQKTPAQVLAKLEDPKLARAIRVKLLMEVVPELIENYRPDKESSRSEAANENSPALVRRMFAVADEQRQQRKFIDDGASFRKARERYAALESKLPKASAAGD
ncbi:hypothetical protein TA3x_001542 [Tundrisphaera sp. TA3]|uniref:hypothetical protein n=1 Tax=Tundrisphaera sp. TA3 TaxID=3435775 RepID=UPI003EBFF004